MHAARDDMQCCRIGYMHTSCDGMQRETRWLWIKIEHEKVCSSFWDYPFFF